MYGGGGGTEVWSNQRQVRTKAGCYFSGVGFQLLAGGEDKGGGIRGRQFFQL